jgi:hypothetical protein
METVELLRARARRAYELHRAGDALRLATVVIVAAAAALACGRPAPLVCAVCVPAFPLVAFLSWRGGVEGRAMAPALGAGLAALALPLAVRMVGHACVGDACMTLCQPACIVAGAAAGAYIGLRAAREDEQLRYAVAALAVAALLGALGCSLVGGVGVLGMLAGAVGAGTPVLVHARARR